MGEWNNGVLEYWSDGDKRRTIFVRIDEALPNEAILPLDGERSR
jgi:hypothetical protein